MSSSSNSSNRSNEDNESPASSNRRRRRRSETNNDDEEAEEEEALSSSLLDNDNDNDNDNQTKKRTKKRLRLLREIQELKEDPPSTTIFPGDDGYQDISNMIVNDDNKNNNKYRDYDEDDDEDYQEGDGDDDVDIRTNAPRNNNDNDNQDGIRFLDNDNGDEEEEEGEGEDLLENAFQDYQRIEALDTYGREGIDNRQYDGMDYDERVAAEMEIAQREEELQKKQKGDARRGTSFYEGLMDDMQEDEDARKARRGAFGRSGRRGRGGGGGDDGRDSGDEDDDDMGDDDDEEDGVDRTDQLLEQEEELNLEAFDVPLREWIAQDRTRREVMRKFIRFIETPIQLHDEQEGGGNNNRQRKQGLPIYEERVRNMCSSNQSTLEISYSHLMDHEPILAMWLVDAPRDMFDVLNEAATRKTLKMFQSYGAIQDEIHVRVSGLPIIDSLRGLRKEHLDRLVRVNGVVTRRSSVYPQLKLAYYECFKCKQVLGPYRVDESTVMSSSGPDGSAKDAATLHQPSSCSYCESAGPFRVNTTKTQYRNYQRINLQETPGSVPPGRVPRTKEVVLTNDLIDAARPGEEVEITGIFSHTYDYNLTQKSGFPVFSTFIGANHVRRKEDVSSSENLTEEDIAEILDLAKDPKIGDRIVESIAPSIYGHRHVKMALAMSLFGAVPKNINDKHRIRGDINVLLLGDPGTAKSQMLKYAEATAPRAVYSTGKGASAVGLTASVHKDPLTKEWTLEGGALVLADRGVCLIDEFDKMNEQDRTSIHEAMEQQSISVSKAGIVTSLQARCAVIAAANPIGGRYDSSCTFAENVELTDPILQRFDLLCVLQDTVDPVADEKLATFVTGSHMRSVPTNEYNRGTAALPDENSDDVTGSGYSKAKVIPQSLLRKYIQYARKNFKPALNPSGIDQQKVSQLYVALRRESVTSGGVPIAVRHIESIMRLSEAHAKMHLRDHVREDDMNASIAMMLQSFIMAQKFSVRRQLQRSFARFISSSKDRSHLLLHILQDMMRNEAMYQTIRLRQRGINDDLLGMLEIPLEEFESRARDRKIYDVTEFCHGDSFSEAGYVLDEERGMISRDENVRA